VIAGGVLWTLAEYVNHRAVYHRVSFLKQYHDAHHANPRAYLGAPPGMGTGLIFLTVFLPTSVLVPFFANGLTIGMLAGYAAYQLVHHAAIFQRRGAGVTFVAFEYITPCITIIQRSEISVSPRRFGIGSLARRSSEGEASIKWHCRGEAIPALNWHEVATRDVMYNALHSTHRAPRHAIHSRQAPRTSWS
jgi:hypothetical protein